MFSLVKVIMSATPLSISNYILNDIRKMSRSIFVYLQPSDRKLIMKIFLVAVVLGFANGSYINNDVCKTEYNTVCEEVEKPHVEHKTECICDTVYSQQC